MCYIWTMRTIGVRELRQHASRYLSDVKSGFSVIITERGIPVAQISPLAAPSNAVAQLEARCTFIRATQEFALPRPIVNTSEATSAAILDALREDRFE